MSHPQAPAQDGLGDATADRRRRWYHLRPKHRRPTDFMGFNATLWMVLVWPIVIVLAVFPFPWWW
jgi:hypothetical protein